MVGEVSQVWKRGIFLVLLFDFNRKEGCPSLPRESLICSHQSGDGETGWASEATPEEREPEEPQADRCRAETCPELDSSGLIFTSPTPTPT